MLKRSLRKLMPWKSLEIRRSSRPCHFLLANPIKRRWSIIRTWQPWRRYHGAFRTCRRSRLWQIGLVTRSRVRSWTKSRDFRLCPCPPKRKRKLPKANKKPKKSLPSHAWGWTWRPNMFKVKPCQLLKIPNLLLNVPLSLVRYLKKNPMKDDLILFCLFASRLR